MSYVVPPKSLVLELERYLKAHKRVISYELLETDNYLNIDIFVSENVGIDIYFLKSTSSQKLLQIEFRLFHKKGAFYYMLMKLDVLESILTNLVFSEAIELLSTIIFDVKQGNSLIVPDTTIHIDLYEKGKAAALPTGND